MKTIVLTAILATTLAGAGSAMADAECQAGSAWGYKAGCGGYTDQREADYYTRAPAYQHPDTAGRYQEGRRSDPRWLGAGPAHRVDPRRFDRDGDGVPDNRDRKPRDPRRW